VVADDLDAVVAVRRGEVTAVRREIHRDRRRGGAVWCVCLCVCVCGDGGGGGAPREGSEVIHETRAWRCPMGRRL
jgi:hypothetical protein